ncbi:MAG: DUF4446 family protein [Patescibacteria group bacterium]
MAPISSNISLIILSIVIVLLCVWLFTVERRLRKFLMGKNAQSLEGAISSLGEDVRKIEKSQKETADYLNKAEVRIKRSVQGVETIRFNAFKGTGEGGNQSFAIALLSENGDGTVVSSLYARDRQSVFAKPVKNFSSEYEMTVEEKEVVERARRV